MCWGVAEGTGGGTYLGVQVLLWVGTSDGVHRGLVRVRRRRVGRRSVVTLGWWHLVGSPRSVPCHRHKRGASQGLAWLLRAGRRAEHPHSKQAPKTAWDGEEKARLSPAKTLKCISLIYSNIFHLFTQIYLAQICLTYLLHQCSAIREGQDFKSNIPHHLPGTETG